jgi:hypothetical protein
VIIICGQDHIFGPETAMSLGQMIALQSVHKDVPTIRRARRTGPSANSDSCHPSFSWLKTSVLFFRLSLGVSQEEVQKMPQLGTTR